MVYFTIRRGWQCGGRSLSTTQGRFQKIAMTAFMVIEFKEIIKRK
jgi:hypothetical protein